jgi:hypothetical protein
MKHYSETDILALKKNIQHNCEKLSESIKWVDANLKYDENNALTLKLKNTLNTLKKVEHNIDSKPVIAVFGASQVGKSYLIKNLLSQQGRPFFIKNDDKEYDFLKEINPPGVGAESTGVVTRFTVDQDIKFTNFPIKIKLLSAKDILIIVLDSFFLDLKKISYFINKKDLDKHIDFYESQYQGRLQTNLTEYDILEIKEYFENHLSKHTILFEGLEESHYFERIGKIIDGFNPTVWNSIFKVLWNDNQFLSELFLKLITTLQELEFDSVAYLNFKEVLRDGGEILDVTRLQELYTSSKSTIIKKENGSEKSIHISMITALTAELIFSINPELTATKAFLKNSDLLDFPGARSRLALDLEHINEDVIPSMLLRGKVSYLFNKYSDDFNINNLLFCTNDIKLEINEIPALLFNWISKNIGENAYTRSKALDNVRIPPLFVIFTFFNNQLKYDSTNDFEYIADSHKLDYKWDTRFVKFFENEIVTQSKDWHVNWTQSQINFQNFYLLRDLKYSTDTFSGYEEYGYESDIKEERLSYLEKVKESFLNSGFVQKHFDQPQKSWKSSVEVNKDGSDEIIENLSQVSNNLTKINHYIAKTNSLISEIRQGLNKYLYTDDLSTLRTNNMIAVNGVQSSFNIALAKDINSFNFLIKRLSIQPVEVYNLLSENFTVNVNENTVNNLDTGNILLTTYPELKEVNTYEEAIEILKIKLWLSSDAEVEAYLTENGINKENLIPKPTIQTRAQYYTELVIEYWLKKASNHNDLQHLLINGISASHLNYISDHFRKIITRRNLKEKLERILNDVVSEIFIEHPIKVFLAETFSLVINEIVTNFDIHFFSEEEKIEIEKLYGNQKFNFYNKNLVCDDHKIAQFFDDEGDHYDLSRIVLDKYNKWIEYLRISAHANCGFVHYDEQANNALRSLINEFNESHLSQ